jgi:hypothetical protein
VELRSDYPLADAIRVVVFILAGGNVMMSALIARLYVRMLRLERRHRMRRRLGARPVHVGMLALSYVILTVVTLIDLEQYVNQPNTWRPFAYGPAYVLGFYALLALVRNVRVRIEVIEAAVDTRDAT